MTGLATTAQEIPAATCDYRTCGSVAATAHQPDQFLSSWAIPVLAESRQSSISSVSRVHEKRKILVVDPESVQDLCYNLGGEWINAVGGFCRRFNLQIAHRPVTMRSEKENETVSTVTDEGCGIMNDLACM